MVGVEKGRVAGAVADAGQSDGHGREDIFTAEEGGGVQIEGSTADSEPGGRVAITEGGLRSN